VERVIAPRSVIASDRDGNIRVAAALPSLRPSAERNHLGDSETLAKMGHPADTGVRPMSWGESGGGAAGASTWRCGKEGGGELFVEGEEVFDAGLIVGEGLGPIAAVYGAVELLVGAKESGRHEERVIEGGEGGVGELGAGVDNGLGELFDSVALGVGGVGGPGIVVVDDISRVSEVRLDSPTHLLHPSNVHCRRQDA